MFLFGLGRNLENGPWLVSYQVLVIVWITTSLGYWVMVANFISRALRLAKACQYTVQVSQDLSAGLFG